MPWADKFIAVDWGTTNRRAWLLDGRGEVLARHEDAQGVLAVTSFPDAIAELRARLGDVPLLMAGMVGSNRGWIEVPYAACPVGLEELARGVARPAAMAAIVPGVRLPRGERADVMRGEEVQALGAVAAGLTPRDGITCHPGTHAKWIRMQDARIVDFRTVMTGELFDLLRTHSILADALAHPVVVSDAFRAGVQRGLANAVTGELFSVRAGVLLGELTREDASSFASGLLIGADVRVGLGFGEAEVALIGRPQLTALYRAALAEAGRTAREIDGDAAFLAGIARIAEVMS